MKNFIIIIIYFFTNEMSAKEEIWSCYNQNLGNAVYKINVNKPVVELLVENRWLTVASDSTLFNYDSKNNALYALSQPNNKAGFIFDLKNKIVFESYRFEDGNKNYESKCLLNN